MEPAKPPTWKGGKGKKGKGKGKGWGRRAIGGILSLDESARLHGTTGWQDFESGQLKRFAEGPSGRKELLRPKRELAEAGSARAQPHKLMKGMPTVAVMTPAPDVDDFNDI
mmetsp:Transcript_72525/g.169957  ORF Transcript_72525/g.169957 Transcript_72525/m.169957 type:complete len:111 (-) Transcript_72525:53-385(-)